jgi:ribonuclease T2
MLPRPSLALLARFTLLTTAVLTLAYPVQSVLASIQEDPGLRSMAEDLSLRSMAEDPRVRPMAAPQPERYAQRRPLPGPKPRPKPRPNPGSGDRNVPGKFDYYVMALSWSPDFCASKGGRDPQCGRPLGFVLHGLWPQYTKGYPADCSNEPLPASIKQEFADLFPSAKLMEHEWNKHGTCSGLGARGYMQLSQRLKAELTLPEAYQRPTQPFRTTSEQLRQALVAANSTLPATAIAPSCSGSGRFLQEVKICYNKSGNPIPCAEDVLKTASKSCAQPDFLVRSVR